MDQLSLLDNLKPYILIIAGLSIIFVGIPLTPLIYLIRSEGFGDFVINSVIPPFVLTGAGCIFLGMKLRKKALQTKLIKQEVLL
ncbi:MAG: hypothetical protein ACFFCZ_18720 [Promethearchaeota archaeon]